MVFAFARKPSYQVLPNVRSGLEIASQAEYAGSIPVIGSTSTSANGTRMRFGFSPVPLPYPDLSGPPGRVRAQERNLRTV
jgi:hypothetical protein